MTMPFMGAPDFLLAPVFSATESGEVVDEQVTRPRRQQGQLAVEPVAPMPFALDRDPVAEIEARERVTDALEEKLMPGLFRARRTLERAVLTMKHYGRELSDLRFALSQARAEAGATSPDSPAGIKEQRQAHVRALAGQVAEADSEYQAAVEEVQQAERIVHEEMAKHQANLEAQKAQR